MLQYIELINSLFFALEYLCVFSDNCGIYKYCRLTEEMRPHKMVSRNKRIKGQ